MSDGRVTTRGRQCIRQEGDYKRQTVSEGRVTTRGRQCVRREGDYKRQTACQRGG